MNITKELTKASFISTVIIMGKQYSVNSLIHRLFWMKYEITHFKVVFKILLKDVNIKTI